MCVYERELEKISQNSTDFKLISEIKEAVNILTDKEMTGSLDFNEFKLQNQNGVSLETSKEDTRSLTSAMILYEKGKSFMKSKNYVKALILFAESDNEFK
jgi:hypothetical protein